ESQIDAIKEGQPENTTQKTRREGPTNQTFDGLVRAYCRPELALSEFFTEKPCSRIHAVCHKEQHGQELLPFGKVEDNGHRGHKKQNERSCHNRPASRKLDHLPRGDFNKEQVVKKEHVQGQGHVNKDIVPI